MNRLQVEMMAARERKSTLDLFWQQWCAGNKDGFARLYHDSKAQLFRRALVLTCDKEAAEDLTQSFYMDMINLGREGRTITNIEAYMFSGIRYRALDWIKREAVKRKHLASVKTENRRETEEGGFHGIRNLEKLLQKLPEEQREVLVLKIYEDLTFQEIAGELGISADTAASRYRYAVAKIKPALEQEMKNDE